MDFKNEIENECGFHIVKTEGFCSPYKVVEKLKSIAGSTELAANNGNLLQVLKNKYNCNSETCVLSSSEVQNHIDQNSIKIILKENFKPLGPKMSRDWLSNFDIDDVLEQMKKKYKEKYFLHIPFQMRDFEKTGSELSKLDWNAEYSKGFRTFGTVMNTDYSTGRGIHWFAIFGDFLDDSEIFTIEYFNSSGELPLPEVVSWMKKFKFSLNFEKPVKDVVVTRIVNQQSSSECGLYSIYYIVSRLHGVPMKWFEKNRVRDKVMYEFRKYLFRDKDDPN